MGIKGYHSNQFPGRTGGALKVPRNQPLVGVEFETEISGRDYHIYRVEETFAGKEIQFFPEEDSSLSSGYGVEFVSSPGPANLFTGKRGPLASLLDIIESGEIRKDYSDIGMHVNVSAKSEDHAWATAVIGNLLGNISRRISGRGDAYSNHITGGFYKTADNYEKGPAVSARQRGVTGEPWTDPVTNITLPGWASTIEWRNEFRCHRSTTVHLLARMQIRYSVLVSQFAATCIKDLMQMKETAAHSEEPDEEVDEDGYRTWEDDDDDDGRGDYAFPAGFVSNMQVRFLEFVKARARGKGLTARLFAILNDTSKSLWSAALSGDALIQKELDMGLHQHLHTGSIISDNRMAA